MKRKSVAFNPVDIHVGSRVRMRRNFLGMTRPALGNAIGITFQQLQTNERGANRIGASRLFELSRALDVPVSFFFDDMPEEVAGSRNVGAGLPEIDVLGTRDAHDITSAYYGVEDRAVRRALFQMVKALARARK